MEPHALLRRLQARMKLSQADFARGLGISRQNYWAYLHGKPIGEVTAKRIAQFTGVAFHHFLNKKVEL